MGRRRGDPTGPHLNRDAELPKGTEHCQESREKSKVMNDLTVPPDGCGLQWSSGQIGFSCQISCELGFLGSVVAIVTVRNKYQVLSAWHEPGAVLGRPTHVPTGRQVPFFSSPDKLWKLRPGQDEALAQGHSQQVVKDENSAF